MFADRTGTLRLVKVSKRHLPEGVSYGTIADYDAYSHFSIWLNKEKIGEGISYWQSPTSRLEDDIYLDHNFCIKYNIPFKNVGSLDEGARSRI